MVEKNAELLLEIKTLEKNFPGVKALKGVDLQIGYGEIHGLMGENGAGKSTLIKVLTGLYKKDSGKIFFDNQEVDIQSTIEANSVGISTIYQELNLSTYQKVYENLFLGREPRNKFGGIDHKKMIEESERILTEINIDIDVTKELSNFSTAIQQMVAIARAISTNTKLVIMDEPTSSLDKKEVEVLFGIMRKLKDRGVSVIFISHKLDEIFEICDRLTILKDGSYVGNYDVTELNQLQLISLMIGSDAIELERSKEYKDFSHKEELLRVENIHRGMRLNGIGIDVKAGEIVGLAGLLGSGRTELARVIFGADSPTEGEIFWLGQKAYIKKPSDAIKKGMGFCTEDRKVEGIMPNLSVKENLTIALLPKIKKLVFIDNKKQDEVVDEFIKKLNIKTPSPDQAIKNLSGGNQQKVLLARWMCMNPDLIIMDEPTRGIDVGAKAEIENLIQELADKGVSILMISSEIPELERNCDRIIVMREGREAGELTGTDMNADKIMETIARGNLKEA